MTTSNVTPRDRLSLAHRAASLAAQHPAWSRDRIGRELGLSDPRGAREKAVLRLLQLLDLPEQVRMMFAEGAISFAATEELGAHKGLTNDEKISVAQKVAAGVLPAGGKQLRGVLEWLGAARHHSYGQRFLADRDMTYRQAQDLQDELESRRQEAIDREAEAEVLARAIEAERLGPQVVRELGDLVDRLRVVSEVTTYVAHDRLHRPKVTAQLLTARELLTRMLDDVGHVTVASSAVDTA